MELILLTGCSGRIGEVIVKKFQGQNVQIVGFDIVAPKFSQSNFEYMKLDLTSEEEITKTLEAVRKKYGNTIASFIHLAAYYNFQGGRWEMYQKLSIDATNHLMKAMKSFRCEQFLFSSSMLAMEPCVDTHTPLTEASPMSESWEYPRSKKITEADLKKNHGTVPLVILRIAGCYDDECHSIPISNQIQRIYEHQMTARLFPGDKTHGACYIHLNDVAEAVKLCVQKRKELPQETTLLLGEEDVMTYDDLQREISHLVNGNEITTIRIPKIVAKVGAWAQNTLPFMPKTFIKPWMIDLADDHYAVDISKTKELLGFAPKYLLRQTLPLMIKGLLRDPQKFYQDNGLEMPCAKKACCGCKK